MPTVSESVSDTRIVSLTPFISRLNLLLTTMLTLAPSTAAHAHAAERGFILLLPTDLYIFGSAAVVAMTFVLMAVVPSAGLRAILRAQWNLISLPRWNPLGSYCQKLVTVVFRRRVRSAFLRP